MKRYVWLCLGLAGPPGVFSQAILADPVVEVRGECSWRQTIDLESAEVNASAHAGTAEADGNSDPSALLKDLLPRDFKILLKRSGLSLQARRSVVGHLSSGEWTGGPGLPLELRILGGQVSHTWGLGLVWPSGEMHTRQPGSLTGRPTAMLKTRSSVSRAAPKRTGMAIHFGSKDTSRHWAAWGWKDAWGVAGRWRGAGLSVGRARDLLGQAYLGSICIVGARAPGSAAPAAFAMEVCARYGPVSEGPQAPPGEFTSGQQRTEAFRAAMGLIWTLKSPANLGIWGARLWTGPRNGLARWEDECGNVRGCDMPAGWEMSWGLPRLPMTKTELKLSSTRPEGTTGRSMEQRDAKISIATMVLSALRVRLTLRQTEVIGAAPKSLQTAHQALGVRAQTCVDLRMDLARPGQVALALRLRQSIGRRALWGQPGPLPDEIEVDDGSFDATSKGSQDPWEYPGSWQQEGSSSLTALSLRWRETGPWRWGLMAALSGSSSSASASGGGGANHAYVPIRLPPGRVTWRVIGPGTWIMETWVGRSLGAMRWEIMGRLRTQAGGEQPQLELGVGIQWHLS